MKPILFNTDMVRAILDNEKTVTRRVVKLPGNIRLQCNGLYTLYADGTCYKNQHINEIEQYIKKPYKIGDILYIRETWGHYSENRGDAAQFMYRADYQNGVTTYMHSDGVHKCDLPKWKPSIHMPKEAARIFLQVTDIRMERLQNITEEQATKEGCKAGFLEYKGAAFGDEYAENWTAVEKFIDVWNSTINKIDFGIYGWNANPYVRVVEFEKIDKLSE